MLYNFVVLDFEHIDNSSYGKNLKNHNKSGVRSTQAPYVTPDWPAK